MNTKEFVQVIKENFEILPTRTELKQFIQSKNMDINKSTDEITLLIVDAYRGVNYSIPQQRKKHNNKFIKKEDIQKCLDLGMKHTEITKYLGISACKLSQLKSKYDLLRKPRDINAPDFEEFMKYHTQAEAAKYYNVNVSEISRKMKKLGIKGKRDFMSLWIELKKVANLDTIKIMNKLEG
jgi:hypothetical protein